MMILARHLMLLLAFSGQMLRSHQPSNFASDQWERSSLGANWTAYTATIALVGNLYPGVSAANTNAKAGYTAKAFTANQTVELTMAPGYDTSHCALASPAVRYIQSGNQRYELLKIWAGGVFDRPGDPDEYVIKRGADSNSGYIAFAAATWTLVAGDRLAITAIDTDANTVTITGYYNGQQVIQGTDTSAFRITSAGTPALEVSSLNVWSACASYPTPIASGWAAWNGTYQ